MTSHRCDVLVLFGATGDLAYKQIFPALFSLFKRGRLNIPVVGIARSKLSQAEFHQRAKASLTTAALSVNETEFAAFASNLRYVSGDYTDPATFEHLERELSTYSFPLFYMAIPPDMFEVVTHGIKRMGCGSTSRLMVEKPFGRDLASAQTLNKTIHHCFPEDAVYRVDHFLAMETVANLVYFRHANAFLHPLWCHRHIKNIQITLAEDFGIEGRGAFYDAVGAVRDVVQNHLFQILGLLTMEPPNQGTADDLHQAQLDVFRCVKPVQMADVVFGQFEGYRTEPGVHPESNTETYVAMRLEIENERWQSVPIYIRAGKRLAATCTEVMITLKDSDHSMPKIIKSTPNHLRFRLHPDMVIALGVQIKKPGRALEGEMTELIVQNEQRGGITPYERLLSDGIKGDKSLFTRSANMEAAWRILESTLNQDATPVKYRQGSWGPDSSCHVLTSGDTWQTPKN